MKKIVDSTLDLSTKAVSSLDKYQMKNMGWKYQFAMAYIRALVMSAYKEINCLISQPKHYVVGTQKNRRNESTKIIG